MQRIMARFMAGLGAAAVVTPALAEPVVENIRLGLHPDRTRLVVDLTENTRYVLNESEDRRRLVIELPQAEAKADMGAVAGLGLIDRVSRFKRAGQPGFRLILDTTAPAEIADAFLLPAEGDQPWRLVIDLAQAPPAPEPSPPPEEAEAAPREAPADTTDITRAAPAEEPAARMPEPGDAPVMMAGAAPPEESAASQGAPPDALRHSFSGHVEGEVRIFPQDQAGKSEVDASAAVELRYEAAWNNGLQTVTLVPFGRLDAADGARSHADLREAKWTGVFGDIEARIGIDRIFWGVTESLHLVDIINQIDGVEDVDEEDKLGQPMVSLSWSRPWGTITGYFLPYFRERTFPGSYYRPYDLRVADDLATFASRHENWRTDWALRYAHSAGPFDIGLSYFSGMQRDPYLTPAVVDGEPALIPHYDVIEQAGLDLQGTFGPLLLKFEGISVDGANRNYYAAAGGFEYTFFGALGDADLGILTEYLWDERNENYQTPFEDDLFVGMRYSGNNTADTAFLAGAIFDMDSSTTAANVEASHRLGAQWLISLDGRFFLNVADDDPLRILSHGDVLRLRLDRYF